MSVGRQVSYPVSPSPSSTVRLSALQAGPVISTPSGSPQPSTKFVRPPITGVVIDAIGKIGTLLLRWFFGSCVYATLQQ